MPHDSPTEPILIDVVVSVFKGLTETRRCLESVLQSTCQRHFELVVIDDCSPQPEIGAYLADLTEEGRIALLRNATLLPESWSGSDRPSARGCVTLSSTMRDRH